ncbi:uncharacterized protein [Narcine bancroftii]|uniref:uncharacterized protein isoform X2 n=1 Tax=Narcine bancroftii TaxID=1343680 RepID=UPI0038315EFA
MAYNPTYTNFQVVHRSREIENVYSNFCSHQRHSTDHQGKRGWTEDITCGGWTIHCGKVCILYFILAMTFLITLTLLIVGLVKINKLATDLKEIKVKQNEFKQLATNITVTLKELKKSQIDNPQVEANTTVTAQNTSQDIRGTDVHCLTNGSSCVGKCRYLFNQSDWCKANKRCPLIQVQIELVDNREGQVNSDKNGTQYETTSGYENTSLAATGV